MGVDGSVTIMFTDVEAPLMETLGEESWLELLEWHDRAVRQQTTLFGGSVSRVKVMGSCWSFRRLDQQQPAP
jgi:class 3 adenylate cyclase